MAERVGHHGVVTRLAIKRQKGLEPEIHGPPRRRARPGAEAPQPAAPDSGTSEGASKSERTGGSKDGAVPMEVGEGNGWEENEIEMEDDDEKSLSILPREDPVEITQAVKDEIMTQVLQEEEFHKIWDTIRTKYRSTRLGTQYQLRIPAWDSHTMTDVKAYIRAAFEHFGKPAKMTVNCSYLIHDRDTNQYRVFWQVSAKCVTTGDDLMFRVKILSFCDPQMVTLCMI